MSASPSNGFTKPLPQSPSFAPRRLGFSKKELNNVETPKSHRKRTRSKTTNSSHSNKSSKESKSPNTPSHTAHDNQYKSWLQRNGFHQLFRDSHTLSFVINILRQYSSEIYSKIEAVIAKNNELNSWKREVGEPALNSIERYKLIESELKSAQSALNSEYRQQKREYRELKNEYADLKREIRDIYSPKIQEYERLLKDNESLSVEITHLNDCLIKKESQVLVAPALASASPHDDLPAQFHSDTNSSRFDWDYMNGNDDDDDDDDDGDDDDGGGDNAASNNDNIVINNEDSCENNGNNDTNDTSTDEEIRSIFNELSMKIETFCSSERREHQNHQEQFAKLHENVQKLYEKQDGIIEMKKSLNSLNTSISTIQGSHSFQFQPDEFNAIHNMNEKMDKLTMYLRNLRIDQRIITLYKKINEKIEDQMSEKDNAELLELLRSVQFEQESQSKLIDNSLLTFHELFEHQLSDIYKVINERKQVKCVQSPSISPIKGNIKGIQRERERETRLFDSSYDESRLNEVFLTQFVLVLINNLSSATQMATNKLFLCIIKITNNLLSFNINSFIVNSRYASYGNGNGEECDSHSLIQYKVEIENLFQNIFQNTINSVIHQLIDNKLDRVQLQSKISKLTHKFEQTKINLNDTENKKNVMMRQLHKIAKKQIYYPLITAAIIVFICGIVAGYIVCLSSYSSVGATSSSSFMS